MSYSDADKKKHIEEVQQYLRGISYKDSRIPRIIPDGIYGPETRSAVKIFQEIHNLPVTGTVDEQSNSKIYDEYTKHTV